MHLIRTLQRGLIAAAAAAIITPSLGLNAGIDSNGDIILSIWNQQDLAARTIDPAKVKIGFVSSAGNAVAAPVSFVEMKTGQASQGAETTLRYSLDRRAMPSDMYSIHVTAATGFARDANGQAIEIRPYAQALYVPARAQTVPSLIAGQPWTQYNRM